MRLLDLLYPPKCIACGELLDWYDPMKGAFCPKCLKLWENATLESCGICGSPVKECSCMTVSMEKAECRAYLKRAYYQPGKQTPIPNRLLFCMKSTREARIFSFVASELFRSLEILSEKANLNAENTVVTFAPRSHGARLEFGLDQARLLAKEIAKVTGFPFVLALRRKLEWGRAKPQKTRTPKERMLYARRCYSLSPKSSVDQMNVILVDDVVTTGATMSACATLLYKGGALNVFCVSAVSNEFNRDGIR